MTTNDKVLRKKLNKIHNFIFSKQNTDFKCCPCNKLKFKALKL